MPGLDEYEKISFSPEGKPTVDLSHCAVSWSDNLGARCASVEYIKRDGAEVQTPGHHRRFSSGYRAHGPGAAGVRAQN